MEKQEADFNNEQVEMIINDVTRHHSIYKENLFEAVNRLLCLYYEYGMLIRYEATLNNLDMEIDEDVRQGKRTIEEQVELFKMNVDDVEEHDLDYYKELMDVNKTHYGRTDLSYNQSNQQ